jgi:dephospho-CoA kinase
MLRLGLTGGIASGKSTVAAMLRDLHFIVLDADSIAHQLIEPGTPANEEILREFGASIADAHKKIDRAALGKIVFADSQKLARLNAIVHPRVEESIAAEFSELQKDPTREVAFVEAALIVEAGLDKILDGLVVAWCKPEQQIARLIARGMSAAEAQQRIATQLSPEKKLQHATEKIDCSGSLAETLSQVQRLAGKLRRKKIEVGD